MTYFITTNSNSRATELFNDEYLAPPEGAIQISDADGEMLRRANFSDYVLGADGVITYAPDTTQVRLAQEAAVRARRNKLLAETDWTQARDVSDDVAQLWAPYRQALRDITDQAEFPEEVVWPDRPKA